MLLEPDYPRATAIGAPSTVVPLSPDGAWDSLSGQWLQHGVMGMEAA